MQQLSDGEGTEGRQRIILAARPLFIAFGFKAVSMQQIASATGIHKATLYHHFRNKEDLFSAVVEIAMGEAREEIASEIERGGSAAEQLTRVALKLFARSESDFGRFMSDAYENLSPIERERLFTETFMPWPLIEAILKDAVTSGDLPLIDPGFAVKTFVGMIWGQTLMRRLQWRPVPLDETLARNLVGVLIAGLQVAPVATDSDSAI